MKLHTRIFLGLVAGIAIGAASKLPGTEPLQRFLVSLEPLGTVFIRLITMVVVPLVVASLFVGVASLGDVRRLGRIGGKTLVYFLVTSVIAATIGLAVAHFAHVGQGLDLAARDALTGRFGERGANAAQAAATSPSLVQTLVDMTPQNPFASAAQSDLLPLIIAVLFFGAAATVIPEDRRRPVVGFFEGVNDLATVIIGWLMALAPAAVLVLIAATVARLGVEVLKSLLVYTVVVVVALAAHAGVVLLPALRLGARLGVRAFGRSVSDALLLAFSTASSNVALPVSMAAARDRLRISNGIVSFLLPAGTTLNKNGAAVYKAVTAVFIAQLYGFALGPGRMVTIVLTTVLAASAGAGVPGSSLVTTLIVLNAIGLGPYAAAGIALVIGVDRPLDMCRTLVNTLSNLIGAAVVARSEGETLG